MKMLHLKQIETALPKLINIELPVRIAYRLNLILDEIDKHLKSLQEFRVTFLNKHGNVVGDNKIKIDKEKIQEFDKGLEELLQEEIDIKPVEIPLSLLINTDIKLTVMEIESLKDSGFLVDDLNT